MNRARRGTPHPAPPPAAPAIQLHIERLVIEGLPLAASDAARLRTALEQELTVLLARSSPPASGPARPRPLHLATGGSPAAWGRQIAGQVYARVAPQIRQAAEPAAPITGKEGPV